jgi:amino acid permease
MDAESLKPTTHFYDEKLLDDEHDDDGQPKRRGSSITAAAHIITAVIGSGVLSLAWGVAQIGWAFGVVILFMFSLITWYCACLLCDSYRTPDPDYGKRNYKYMDAVQANLGGFQVALCGIVQYINLIGAGVGYTITGSIALVAFKRSDCFHNNPAQSTADDGSPGCTVSNTPWMIFFGALQLVFSQIENFHELWWLSIFAAIMSFSYSTIGLGLSIGKATQHTHSHGTAWGTAGESTPAAATWNVFNSLGDMAFAYSFSNILLEICDTLKKPADGRGERWPMKRATTIAIFVTTGFYMAVGCVGYAAFGNDAPGNLMTGFGFFNPYWLVDAGNLFIFLHLIGGYQVYLQPTFMAFERMISSKYPNNLWMRKEWVAYVPHRGHSHATRISLSPFRLIWRSILVIIVTIIALLLPFFNDILGLLGALGFFPLTVYFPVVMHIVQFNVKAWTTKWILLQLLLWYTLAISIAAGIGSIEAISIDVQTYKPFHSVSG